MRTKGEIEMKLESELARISREHTVGDLTDAQMQKQLEKLATWFGKVIGKLPISEQIDLLRDYAVRHYEPGNETLKIAKEILQ